MRSQMQCDKKKKINLIMTFEGLDEDINGTEHSAKKKKKQRNLSGNFIVHKKAGRGPDRKKKKNFFPFPKALEFFFLLAWQNYV